MDRKWKEELSIGIEPIDYQHRAIFQRINALREELREGGGRETLSRTVELLESYIDAHLDVEEMVMERMNGDEARIRTLNAEHEQFIAEITAFRRKLREWGSRDDFTPDLETEMERMLSGWLEEHIGKIDKTLNARPPEA